MSQTIPTDQLIPGKWYIIDRFPGGITDPPAPILGPFDTKEQAEKERTQVNIADDCFVSRYNPKAKPLSA